MVNGSPVSGIIRPPIDETSAGLPPAAINAPRTGRGPPGPESGSPQRGRLWACWADLRRGEIRPYRQHLSLANPLRIRYEMVQGPSPFVRFLWVSGAERSSFVVSSRGRHFLESSAGPLVRSASRSGNPVVFRTLDCAGRRRPTRDRLFRDVRWGEVCRRSGRARRDRRAGASEGDGLKPPLSVRHFIPLNAMRPRGNLLARIPMVAECGIK